MNKKYKFILGKLLRGITLLIGLSILTFTLMKSSPIDPVRASVDNDASLTPEQYEAIAEYWGLNSPPIEQYGKWLKNMLQGDMGISRIYSKPVLDIIKQKSKASFALMGFSWTLSGIFGFTLGSLAAFKRGTISDRLIKWLAYFQASVPTFWIGLIFLLIFSVQLGWFPIGISSPIGMSRNEVTFLDKIHHLILPVMTLSILGIANVTLHTREKMIDVLNSEYVIFAKARGESNWEIFKNHALRNAIVPAITLHFAYFGELFGGSVLAEQVFSYPGLGQTLTEAGLKSDMPLLLGIVMIGAIFVFLGNMIGDILTTWINPYLKEGAST